GAQAGDYTITPPTTTANISAKALTVTGVTANNKVYDGNTAATINTAGATLIGVVGSDSVTVSAVGATGTFATKDVGTNITVTITRGSSAGGAQAGDYTITPPTTTANITAKALTVTGITADNKVYDGTTTATIHTGAATLVGVATGDVVTLSTAGATGTFATKDVGNNIVVTINGLTLAGAQAAD